MCNYLSREFQTALCECLMVIVLQGPALTLAFPPFGFLCKGSNFFFNKLAKAGHEKMGAAVRVVVVVTVLGVNVKIFSPSRQNTH